MTKVSIHNKEQEVDLENAKLIGISASAQTERQKGESTIRFEIDGEIAAKLFNALTHWHYDGEEVDLAIVEANLIIKSTFRECSLNSSTRRLYVQFYTPYRVEELSNKLWNL